MILIEFQNIKSSLYSLFEKHIQTLFFFFFFFFAASLLEDSKIYNFVNKFPYFQSIWHLLIEMRQRKNQNDVWNLFKGDHKDTRMMSLPLFWCLYR